MVPNATFALECHPTGNATVRIAALDHGSTSSLFTADARARDWPCQSHRRARPIAADGAGGTDATPPTHRLAIFRVKHGDPRDLALPLDRAWCRMEIGRELRKTDDARDKQRRLSRKETS